MAQPFSFSINQLKNNIMKLHITFLALLFFVISVKEQSPDLIVFNAKVHTLDNSNNINEAIAVANGKIIKTGTDKQVLKLKGKKTQVIDAKGKTIIPGLFDSHMHIIRGGRFYNTELRWDG